MATREVIDIDMIILLCTYIYIYIVSYFQLYETTEGRWCNMLDWQIVVTLDLNNYMSNQGQESPNESKIVMS